MKEFGLFVDGQWRSPADGRMLATINPATEEPWAAVAAASPDDVDRAVMAARRSFDSGVWRHQSRQERAAVLAK
ncbi:MAG: NAD-dependent aldehyde dehydrogenase, partial [Myxococcales bacterium]|nr:NAD-dependent aldehyde dehydrogenase [Myxococcales bacterium]